MSTPRSDQDSPWKDVLRQYFPEAIAFCPQLSEKTGNLYRLPSEAEWEYACRAGATTPFHFGEAIATAMMRDFAATASVFGLCVLFPGLCS